MDPKDVGLLSILLGPKSTSTLTNLSCEQCEVFLAQAAQQEAKLFKIIAKKIVSKVSKEGFQAAKVQFNVSQTVLEYLIRYSLKSEQFASPSKQRKHEKMLALSTKKPFLSEKAPKSETKNNRKGQHKEKKDRYSLSSENCLEVTSNRGYQVHNNFMEPAKYIPPPNAYDNDPVIPPPPKKKPKLTEKPKKKKTFTIIKPILCQVTEKAQILPKENLTQIVKTLYQNPKVSAYAIKNLFQIPSFDILHQLGDFSRKQNAQSLLQLRNAILSLIQQGCTQQELNSIHGFDTDQIKQVYCPWSRQKLVYTSQDIQLLFQQEKINKKGSRKLASKLGVPPSTIKRWFQNSLQGESYNKGMWYASDDEGTSYQKVKSVQVYLRTRDWDKVSLETQTEIPTLQKWLRQFKTHFKNITSNRK